MKPMTVVSDSAMPGICIQMCTKASVESCVYIHMCIFPLCREKDGLNPQVFSPKKPRNGGSPGTIDVVNYLSKADLRDFINAQEKIMQKKSRPQLANAFKAVLQRPESAHLLQGCAQDDLDRSVA